VVGTRPPAADRPDLLAIHRAFRAVDDPRQVTVGIDLLFGGGSFDHAVAHRAGLSVAPWPPEGAPPGLFAAPDGTALIPEELSGETCRTPTLFGNAASTFGIVSNLDRLRALGVAAPPARWADLADPIYAGAIALADPTKSGASAKAFEMIIQQTMRDAATAAGFDAPAIARFEGEIDAYAARRGRATRPRWSGAGPRACGSSSESGPTPATSRTRRARCPSTSPWATRPQAWPSTSTRGTRPR
jgi:hypothetical protein